MSATIVLTLGDLRTVFVLADRLIAQGRIKPGAEAIDVVRAALEIAAAAPAPTVPRLPPRAAPVVRERRTADRPINGRDELVLLALHEAGDTGLTGREICSRLGVSDGNSGGITKALIDLNLVRVDEHGRFRLHRLTERGAERVARMLGLPMLPPPSDPNSHTH